MASKKISFSVLLLFYVLYSSGCAIVRIAETASGSSVRRVNLGTETRKVKKLDRRKVQMGLETSEKSLIFTLNYRPYYVVEERRGAVKFVPKISKLDLLLGVSEIAVWGMIASDYYQNSDSYDKLNWKKLLLVGLPIDWAIYHTVSMRKPAIKRTPWKTSKISSGALTPMVGHPYRLALPYYDFHRKFKTKSGNERIGLSNFTKKMRGKDRLRIAERINLRATTVAFGKKYVEKLTISAPEQLKELSRSSHKTPKLMPRASAYIKWSSDKIIAGRTAKLSITVRNTGKGTIYGLIAQSISNHKEFNGRLMVFGTIKPNNAKTIKISFKTDLPMKNREIPIGIYFDELNDYTPPTIHTRLQITEEPRPKIFHTYKIFDGGTKKSVGNRDGKIQPGESIDLVLSLQNKSEISAKKVVASLEVSNSDVEIFQKSSRRMWTIAPGKTKNVTFNVGLKPNSKLKTIDLRFNLSSKKFRGALLNEWLKLPIDRKIIPPQIVVPPEKPGDKDPPFPGDNDAPILVMISPEGNSFSINKPTLRLIAAATDDTGIKEIQVFVNGNRANVRGIRQKRKIEKAIKIEEIIPIGYGQNQIKLVAIDIDEQHSEAIDLVVDRTQEISELWLLSIGVSKYKNIRNLKYADDDARAIDAYFGQIGVADDHRKLLIDENVTSAKLREVLGELMGKIGENATLLIYFSGHGGLAPNMSSSDSDGIGKYLLTHEADRNNFYGTAFPMDEVATVFKNMASRRIIFIADTCYSGAVGGKNVLAQNFASTKATPNYDRFLNRLAEGEGRVVMTASKGNELSRESDQLGHGVFTHFLLDALKGKDNADSNNDGFISVSEIYSHVSDRVPKVANQHPVLKGEAIGEIIIGRIK